GASTGQGLIVFNENDRNNLGDDSFRRLNDRTGSGGLPDMYVRCMAKDKDGSIWVGTNKGVAVYYNPGDIFNATGYDAQRVIIEQDGYAQYLLESEHVTTVATDGANRKWFGTYGGGVFLLSEDGTKQLLNFNQDNSPLPSNNISCITIDDLTGEVFIGTDKGIVSYRSDATQGEATCGDHYAFPNPVRHDYQGPIAIRGLVDDADVRITDAAGNIVFRTRALGGQAVWNGTDFSGRRAATGIYFVQATNPDGTATCVSKLLMAR
ncbi:MAG: two-component regulator propeller domain-containing protein, partial [Flavobacteriales bacterium]